MHRFCPKDRVLLVTASLEERTSEGGAAAVAVATLAYAPPRRLPAPVLLECLSKSPIARLRYGSASRLRLDSPRIAPSEFDCRVPRERKSSSPCRPPRSSGILIMRSATRVDVGRSDFTTNGVRVFPPTSFVWTKAERKSALRAQ